MKNILSAAFLFHTYTSFVVYVPGNNSYVLRKSSRRPFSLTVPHRKYSNVFFNKGRVLREKIVFPACRYVLFGRWSRRGFVQAPCRPKSRRTIPAAVSVAYTIGRWHAGSGRERRRVRNWRFRKRFSRVPYGTIRGNVVKFKRRRNRQTATIKNEKYETVDFSFADITGRCGRQK